MSWFTTRHDIKTYHKKNPPAKAGGHKNQHLILRTNEQNVRKIEVCKTDITRVILSH